MSAFLVNQIWVSAGRKGRKGFTISRFLTLAPSNNPRTDHQNNPLAAGHKKKNISLRLKAVCIEKSKPGETLFQVYPFVNFCVCRKKRWKSNFPSRRLLTYQGRSLILGLNQTFKKIIRESKYSRLNESVKSFVFMYDNSIPQGLGPHFELVVQKYVFLKISRPF